MYPGEKSRNPVCMVGSRGISLPNLAMWRAIVRFLFFLFFFFPPPCSPSCPPGGAVNVGGTLYFDLADKTTFANARLNCQNKGMDLASVSDSMSFLLAAKFLGENSRIPPIVLIVKRYF